MARFPKPEIRPRLSDKIVSWFNPVAGVERMKARAMMDWAHSTNEAGGNALGGYVGGNLARRSTRNWTPIDQTSANADYRWILPTLRGRSRDLSRNTPIATGAIATNVTSVVGGGLTLEPAIDRETLGMQDDAAETWQTSVAKEFELFCKTGDFTRQQNFKELQALAFRSILESGDVLVFKRYRLDAGDTYGLKLQFVEADRINNVDRGVDTKQMMQGVQLDDDGVPTGYAICSKYLNEYIPGDAPLAWFVAPARDKDGNKLALHLFRKQRPEQVRGLPYLTPVIEALKVLGDYAEAELRAAVINAMFTVFVTSERSDSDAPVIGEASTSGKNDEIKLSSGAIVGLAEGEKVDFADPKRPTTAFDAFTLSILRQIGVALELPLEVLIKHFTASYSASRGALETAWQYFRERRQWLAEVFCQPVYEWFLGEAVASGRIAAPGFFADSRIRAAYCQAEWRGLARISLDPVKDANADTIDLALKVKTRKQIIAERTGGTWPAKVAQLGKEAADITAAGLDPAPIPLTVKQAGAADEMPTGPGDENADENDDSGDKEDTKK